MEGGSHWLLGLMSLFSALLNGNARDERTVHEASANVNEGTKFCLQKMRQKV